MILSGKEIASRVDKDIIIKPFDSSRLNPNSYNLTLSDELVVYTDSQLDMKKDNPYQQIMIPAEGLLLVPNRLYLGRTVEYTETHKLVPMLEGRSSVGRLGLFIHVTAGFGDVGFKGFWTLEIFCVQPIRIYAGVEICQVYYHTIEGDYESYSSGKYQNNHGIQTSQLFRDYEAEK
jgi:dCTP deaminase